MELNEIRYEKRSVHMILFVRKRQFFSLVRKLKFDVYFLGSLAALSIKKNVSDFGANQWISTWNVSHFVCQVIPENQLSVSQVGELSNEFNNVPPPF